MQPVPGFLGQRNVNKRGGTRGEFYEIPQSSCGVQKVRSALASRAIPALPSVSDRSRRTTIVKLPKRLETATTFSTITVFLRPECAFSKISVSYTRGE